MLTSVFSNFIDIWNLHRSFFHALSALLLDQTDPSASIATANLDQPISSLLLSHFPYLSLYTPFVTAFPTTISSLISLSSPPSPNHPNPLYKPAFAAFLKQHETDPRCGKLGLRDWLLTIVQRCPRYLLLLKDLIATTDAGDAEHGQLTAVHALVARSTCCFSHYRTFSHPSRCS